MKYYTFPPDPELAPYVRSFWVLESEVSSDKPYVYRSLADGCPEMVFHYRGRFTEIMTDERTELSFHSGIQGQSQRYRRFSIDCGFGIFGVYLYPFAIPLLLSVSSTEISNLMLDMDTLLGPEGKDLEERVMTAPDNLCRVRIVSDFLRKKLDKPKKIQPAVFGSIQHIIQTRGLVDVPTLAERNFLSVRQFERNFKQFSGFSPKLFSRIARFQAALNEYPNKDKSLSEIALDCGYYDQSHFIHDFKAFSGHHPKTYFSGKAEGAEYRDA